MIELRARFDEESNLQLASRLQAAGAVVIYGVVGFKTHAKMMLILRREAGEIVRYAHLGTGNYHAGNAKLYTDYSLLTSDDALCEDVGKLFSQLIGMGKTLRMKKLQHAPFTLKKGMLDMIARETQFALDGKPAHIIAKFNSLTDPKIIRALYKASQSGVRIDLVRARHVLPAAGHRRGLAQHPCALDHRALPGAHAGVLLPQRRRRADVPLQRRPGWSATSISAWRRASRWKARS